MTVEHHIGNALDVVSGLPAGSVDLVATSPPFLALRNYNGVEGQWGSEDDPAGFLDNLLDLTDELGRVLAPHGSIAVELGDTYSGSGGSGGDYNAGGLREDQVRFSGSAARNGKDARGGKDRWASSDMRPGWPLAKSLCMVPTLYAACLAYGRNVLNPDHVFEPWRVRNVIVWARNNPPVGALGDKVRPATSYITVATRSRRRWFDLDAVREPLTTRAKREQVKGGIKGGESFQGTASNWDGYDHGRIRKPADGGGAPPTDHWWDEPDDHLTWLVNTAGSSLAHYAMWPPKMAERLVLSMCPAEVCRVCGQPRHRITERTPEYAAARDAIGDFNRRDRGEGVSGSRSVLVKAAGRAVTSAENVTVGWSDCGHGNYRPGVVLDPFYGAGTTGAVADLHGRDAIGVDIDPANTALHQARYDECRRALFGVAPPMPGQLELL